MPTDNPTDESTPDSDGHGEAPPDSVANKPLDHNSSASDEPLAFVDPGIRRRVKNRMIDGVLIVHYASRDVPLELDGEMALRLMQNWQAGPISVSRIDLNWASADRSWIGIDMSQVSGLSWHPRPEPARHHAGSDRQSVDTLG